MKETKVIAVCNQKGGVGKTTTSVALATGMNLRNLKTLLIDTDVKQCNATDSYRAKIEGVSTLYDLLFENAPAESCIQHMECGDIIAGDELITADKFPQDASRFFFLRERCEPLLNMGYDYILVDCPPTSDVLVNSVLAFADSVIIPVSCDRYAVSGLAMLNDLVGNAKKYLNNKLDIMGLLLVRYAERLTISKDVSEQLPEVAEMMNTKVFNTKIRECVAVRMAQANQQTIWAYNATSPVCIDYYDLIDEIVKGE